MAIFLLDELLLTNLLRCLPHRVLPVALGALALLARAGSLSLDTARVPLLKSVGGVREHASCTVASGLRHLEWRQNKVVQDGVLSLRVRH